MNNKPTKRLLEMLEFRRPAWSVFEEAFIEKYILPYKPETDSFGNMWIDLGEKSPDIIWSSHTDTVHRTSGLQQLTVNKKDEVRVVPHKDSNCLGADCTTGVWIMLEMIDAGIPGRYIFHRAEEIGGLGSKWIAEHNPDLLKNIDVAIAFDRKGKNEVITYQGISRTCSDEFAISLAVLLGANYKKSDRGMFTDTKNYRGLVPECTNISVGYENAHSATEMQDLVHARWLRDQMIRFDSSTLVIKRTPNLVDDYVYQGGYHGAGYQGQWMGGSRTYTPPSTLFQLVKECPTSTAKILESWGVTFEIFSDLLERVQQPHKYPGDLPGQFLMIDPEIKMLQPPEEVDKKKKAIN
jgi:hypothetical protein